MFDDITARLVRAKEQVRTKRKLEAMLRQTRQRFHEAEQMCALHWRRLQAEKADVDKLEGLGLTALFYTVLGTKREHIEKEKEEYVAAKLKYEAAAKAVEEAEAEADEMEKELAKLGLADAEYEKLLEEKRQLLSQAGGDQARRLLALSERAADLAAEDKELGEALDAGRRALAALEEVQAELNSAANWGTWDMLGGGLAATMVKHSKIDAARQRAQTAQRYLRSFEKELADAGERLGVSLNIGGFATFADYFFDGLIADWVVQSKIQNASSACWAAKMQVESALSKCRIRRAEVAQALEDARNEQQKAVEEA